LGSAERKGLRVPTGIQVNPNRADGSPLPCGGLNILAARILIYLAVRPGALDSTRGVRDWWLGSIQPEPTLREVEAALNCLARAGFVNRTMGPDGTLLWSGGSGRFAGS
jgi:hypothetical protein